MADCTVFGMPIDLEESDRDWVSGGQPLGALVIVKMIGDDGEVGYYTGATERLPTVEALGMARYAQLTLEHAITATSE